MRSVVLFISAVAALLAGVPASSARPVQAAPAISTRIRTFPSNPLLGPNVFVDGQQQLYLTSGSWADQPVSFGRHTLSVEFEPNRWWRLAWIECAGTRLAFETGGGLASVQLLVLGPKRCQIVYKPVHSEEPPGPGDLSLAQQYRPVLAFSKGERFRPISIRQYLSRATLVRGFLPLITHPSPYSLPDGKEQGGCLLSCAAYHLDVDGAEPTDATNGTDVIDEYKRIQDRVSPPLTESTVYWNVVHGKGVYQGWTGIEYWFLYLYNGWWDRHEADWEGIRVIVSPTGNKTAIFSRHTGSAKRQWPNLRYKVIDRPVVFVARGSHANYFDPDLHETSYAWPDVAWGNLRPWLVDYALARLPGLPLKGSWGSGNWIGRFLHRTKDQIVDPRFKSAWDDPFAP